MDLKLSIIVPTHNSEKFIQECIESIMQQTYENLEIICVDSSKDNTLAILQKLAERDRRIRIIQDANGSYGHKINVGIQQATGEYIGIVESDDYILPNMYTDMISKVKDYKVDFIKSNALHFGTIKGTRIFCPERKAYLEDYYDKVIGLKDHRDIAIVGRPTIWTALYRRDFLVAKQIWLNETPGASYQDTAFVILTGLVAETCIFDNHAYYCYRRDNENSSVLSKDKVDYVRQEFEYIVHYLKEHQMYTEEVAELLRKRKLITYRWNCMRLSNEVAESFIASVAHELQEYQKENVATYTAHEQRIYNLLIGECTMEEYRHSEEDVQRKVDQVLEIWDQGEQTVLIGAGRLGQKILHLQQLLEHPYVDLLADNADKVIGSEVEGYRVVRVEDAVRKYPQHRYIIANQKHAQDIQNQLLELGIASDQIMKISAFPGGDALLMRYMEYYK